MLEDRKMQVSYIFKVGKKKLIQLPNFNNLILTDFISFLILQNLIAMK